MKRKWFSYRPSKFLCIFYLCIPLVLCFLSNLRPDNDTWFLIRAGRYVLSSPIPHVDPFTMHEGLSYMMQQWLSADIFAFFYDFAGVVGLAIFVTFIDALFLFLFYRLCMLVSSRHFYLSMGLTFFVGCLLSLGFFVARPQIFSYLIYVLFFLCLESFIHKKKKRYLIFLPFLSFLEVNLHGATWWLLPCIMIPYFLDSFSCSFFCFRGEGYDRKPLFFALFGVMLSAFFNPYGIYMLQYPFTSYFSSYLRFMIVEMRKPGFRSLSDIFAYVTIYGSLFLYAYDKKKIIKIRYFCLLLGGILLAVTARRNYSLFLIFSYFPFASYFKEKGREGVPLKSSFLLYLFPILLVSSLALFFTTDKTNHDLDGAIAYLNQNTIKEEITLYNGFDEGSYLEFQGYYPYIDPRAEVFLFKNNHKKDILKEYYRLQFEGADAESFLQEYSFTHLLVQKKDVLWTFLKDREDYDLVYWDEKYKIYVPN